MDKEFRVTIDLTINKDMSIIDIQRLFRNFCYKDKNIKALKVYTEVKQS